MVVVDVIFENGRFFKVVRSTVYEPPMTRRVLAGIDADGFCTYANVTESFPRSRHVESKQPATWVEWLIWKIFKVCP